MSCFFKKGKNLLLITAALTISVLAGCRTGEKPVKPTGIEEQRPKTNISYFPPGVSQKNADIIVRKIMPKEVRPQESFTIKILIENNADYKVDQVLVSEDIPKGFVYIKSLPAPISRESGLKWNLGILKPKETQQIVITGKPSKTGTIRYSGQTKLNFKVATDSNFASEVNVIEPNLGFALEAPRSALVGAAVPIRLEFANKGNAAVMGTKLVHTLPKGLLTYEGKSKIEHEIGDLAPGAKKVFQLNLKGVETGQYKTTFTAVAEEGITASATLNIAITKPILTITGKAPKKRFVGDKAAYTLTVKNIGNAPANNLNVKLVLPQGVTLVTATEDGIKSGRLVTWKVKSLRPNETKKVTAIAVVNKIQNARAVATAEAKSADQVKTAMVTEIDGVAGLLTTLVDTNDPVPLNDNEIYVIKADNTGSLDATKIKIKCVLPDSMEYVKSEGATKGTLKGKVLTFEPLPSLVPQSTANWKVIVKAVKPGDVRFTVTVESEQLDRPVELIESTHFYK